MSKSTVSLTKSQIEDIPRPTLTQLEKKHFEDLFLTYSNKEGKVNLFDLRNSLISMGFDERNGSLFTVLNVLISDEEQKDYTLNEFINAIENNLGNKLGKKEIRRVFELFVKEKEDDSIYVGDLFRISEELNLGLTRTHLAGLLKDVSALKNEMKYEEFELMLLDKLIVN